MKKGSTILILGAAAAAAFYFYNRSKNQSQSQGPTGPRTITVTRTVPGGSSASDIMAVVAAMGNAAANVINALNTPKP